MAEALTVLKPLIFFVFGMSVYTIFIFNFYKFVGRKDLFEFDFSRYQQSKHPSLRMACHFAA